MSGMWRRFAAWQRRIARWWFTFPAVWELGCVVLIDDSYSRTIAAALAALFAFWAGWHWHEWAQQRKFRRILTEAARDMGIDPPAWLGEWRGRRNHTDVIHRPDHDAISRPTASPVSDLKPKSAPSCQEGS